MDDEAFPNTRAELLNRICQFFDVVKPIAAFAADTTAIEGDTIYFTDLSANNPTIWSWEFEGGTPETSNEQNPEIKYAVPGDYDVKLVVNNAYGSDTLLKTDYIHIDSLAVGIETNSSRNFIMYPNPAKNTLFISCKEKLQSVDIMNIAGEVIKMQECKAKHAEINIADLPTGVYFCRVQIGNEMITKKIIKVK